MKLPKSSTMKHLSMGGREGWREGGRERGREGEKEGKGEVNINSCIQYTCIAARR